MSINKNFLLYLQSNKIYFSNNYLLNHRLIHLIYNAFNALTIKQTKSTRLTRTKKKKRS